MYSELIDNVVSRTGQGSAAKRLDIQAYANSTIRELQLKALFHRDFYEDSATADSSTFIYDKPVRFRTMRSVKYVELDIYPKFVLPGPELKDFDYKWYAADTYFAFFGQSDGDTIALGYYRYARRFKYYATADRPATWDFDTESWSYLPAYDVDDDTRASARDLVGHWLLQYWREVVEEGTMAKILKNVNDQQRASNAFALFKDLQGDILKAESFESMRAPRT